MSMFMEWMKSSLILDIPEIDNQHRELFVRVDKLLEAMKKGVGCEEVIPLIKFLEDYVIEHFSTEHRLMEQSGYPERREHDREHQEFIKKYRQAKLSFQQSGSCSAWVIQFQHLLRIWIKEHIARQDLKLGQFLKNQPAVRDKAD